MFQFCSIHLNCFGRTPPFLLLENSLKNANFSGIFYLLKEPLVATLNETGALTSRSNVAKKGTIIPNLSETLRLPYPKSKKKECVQRDLNISDQFETLISCSTIYFLGIKAQLLQKLVTGNSSIGKKTSWFIVFEGRILKQFVIFNS